MQTGDEAAAGMPAGGGDPGLPELVPLTSLVDLAGDPNGEALARWYWDQLATGAITAYGSRGIGREDMFRFIGGSSSLTEMGRPRPVPAEEWSELVPQWHDGSAVPRVVVGASLGYAPPVASDLHIPRAAVPADPAAAAASVGGRELAVTFEDARLLVQRWRERAVLPPSWPWSAEEFRKSHPALWPDWGETVTALEEAVRSDRLRTFLLSEGTLRRLPPGTWRATPERVDLGLGRVNMGNTYAAWEHWREVHELEGAAEAEAAAVHGTRWEAALIGFRALRDWFAAAWPAGVASAEAGAPADTTGGAPANEHSGGEPPVARVERHANEQPAATAETLPGGEAEHHGHGSRGTRGPKPKDFWPKVLGYAAGWLAEKGEAPNRQRELEDVIMQRIEALKGEASPSTVRSYAKEMLAGYRAQLDDK